MGIDTVNKKLALLHWMRTWEHSLPTAPGTLGQDDEQQCLWGYPGVLWSSNTHIQPAVFDDLTTVFVPYVEDLHDANLNQHDSNPLVRDDFGTVRAFATYGDINTLYDAYLSE